MIRTHKFANVIVVSLLCSCPQRCYKYPLEIIFVNLNSSCNDNFFLIFGNEIDKEREREECLVDGERRGLVER